MATFFIRHGESLANAEQIFAGQTNDAPLSELGFAQARHAAEELLQFDHITLVCSPLRRTRQTAAEIEAALGEAIENIVFDDRLMEYDMGALTNMPVRKLTSHELVSAEGAEDPSEFQARVLACLRAYKNTTGTVVFVSHAGVGRMIEASRLGMNPAAFYDLPGWPNASVIPLELSWLR